MQARSRVTFNDSSIWVLLLSEEITTSFNQYGALVVDWPHKAESKSYFPPKGYAFLLFQVGGNSKQVFPFGAWFPFFPPGWECDLFETEIEALIPARITAVTLSRPIAGTNQLYLKQGKKKL